MNAKILAISLSLFSSSICAQVVSPDGPIPVLTPELLPIWQKHAVLIDGSTNPSAIPYGYAMERVFLPLASAAGSKQGGFQQQLAQLVPGAGADEERIRAIASESVSVAGRVRDEASVKADEVCADLVRAEPGTANAVEFAQRFSAIEAAEAAELTAFYRAAVGDLAIGTRTALEGRVDTDIRGKMKWGHDLVGLANEVPEAFLAHRTQVCQRRLQLSPSEKAWKYTSEPVFVSP